MDCLVIVLLIVAVVVVAIILSNKSNIINKSNKLNKLNESIPTTTIPNKYIIKNKESGKKIGYSFLPIDDNNNMYNIKNNNIDLKNMGINNSNDYKLITSVFDNKCLYSNKSNKGFSTCGSFDNPQLFIPINNNPDIVQIQNTEKKCLKQSGTEIIVTECNINDTTQQWIIEQINGKIGWGDGYKNSVARCIKTCDYKNEM